MKFAHIADCHIGGWREEELRKLGIEALKKAADICIKENVAFLLISGDLFNTSMPQIDSLKEVAEIFTLLKDNDINIYIIPGSHDYSPSGKTMLDVLERAGLVHNVMKFEDGKLQFTQDKTGVKITGLYGRRNSLERLDYASLEKKHLEEEPGFKIFMFHNALEEFKPKDLSNIESESYHSMPKGFNYYAGGHVHYIFDIEKEGYGKIVYPGPLFPNNFKELEDVKYGTICIVDDQLALKRIPIILKEIESLTVDVHGKNIEEARNIIEKELAGRELKDKIVTLRITGELSSGKISDLSLYNLNSSVNAYCLLQNINKLTVKAFEKVEVKGETLEEIESSVIKEHRGQFPIDNEEDLIKTLIQVLSDEKHEGERLDDFEERLLLNVKKLFPYETG